MYFILILGLFTLGFTAEWKSTTSKYYTGTKFQITDRYIPVPLDHASSSGSTLKLYVRRFARGHPKKHVFLITGGPGQSGRPYEDISRYFEGADFDDCWLYTIDHRGTGRSAKLSKGKQYAFDPSECPNSGSLKHYSADNAIMDIITVGDLLKSEHGDKVELFLISSSYGTTLAYHAMRRRPNLFAGVLLNDLYPSYQPTVADPTPLWLELCHEDANCRARFPSLKAVQSMHKEVSQPSFNKCTRYLRDIDDWKGFGTSSDLSILLHWYNNFILNTLDVQYAAKGKYHPLLIVFAFLYQLHECPDLEKFKSFAKDLSREFERDRMVEVAPSSPTTTAIGDSFVAQSGTGRFIPNQYRGGPSHMNQLINKYINFSESYQHDFSSCLSASKHQLFSDCLTNADYVDSLRPYYASVAYTPRDTHMQSFSTNARVLTVGGYLDTNTPLPLSQLAHDKISGSGGKTIFKVKASGHGSLSNSGCKPEILNLLINGKNKSRAVDCVERSNEASPLNWTDYPGFTQYLWPMDQKPDPPKTSKGYQDRLWLPIGLTVLGLLLIGLGVFLCIRRRRSN